MRQNQASELKATPKFFMEWVIHYNCLQKENGQQANQPFEALQSALNDLLEFANDITVDVC